MSFELEDSYCSWCISSGVCTTIVKLSKSGYVPGQMIPIEINCTNKSDVDINKVRLSIKKKIKFYADFEPDTKEEEEEISVLKKGSIPAKTTRNWTVDMEVPVIDIYNMDACTFIKLNYEFKVKIITSGCHSNSKQSQKIVLGTIPLEGFQDNVTNPLYNQMPNAPIMPMDQYQPPIVAPQQQMVQAYPGMPQHQYPVQNVPTPNNSPYPVQSSPYPVQHSPYPVQNMSSAYPTQNTQNIPSPYPNQASPYPTQTSQSPYPGQSSLSPYPTQASQSPYPGQASLSPYPTQSSQSPYPGQASHSPYPTQASHTSHLGQQFQNQGTPMGVGPSAAIGFKVPADGKEVAMPAPHAGSPYPVANSQTAPSAPLYVD